MKDLFEQFKKSLLFKKQDSSDSAAPSDTIMHDALLKHAKGLIEQSRREMGKFYSTWDYHDQVFRSRRVMDKEDRSANAKGQPSKLIVPLSFSQIMTFVSFAVMTVTQNHRFFELEHEGNKEPMLKEPLELILERDCRRNKMTSFLVQFYLDFARFWLGCAEVCYKEEYRMMRMPKQETMPGAFGVPNTVESNDFVKVPKFIGNKIYPVSPYRFFPDTRLPLTRFQEGEFCGSEDMFAYAMLKSDTDNLFNLDFIPKMSETEYNNRRQNTRVDVMDFMPSRTQPQGGQDSIGDPTSLVRSGSVVVTKLVCDITPKNFKINDENVLGDLPFPIRYIIWYANDKTIIRFEEAQYLHGQFPYICAQYLPDQHKTINEGLSSVCDQITNLITWKLNAHITSNKNSLDSKWIVDPAGVDIKSLESRSPYIFLRKNASNTGIDRYIKQFITTDVTAGTMTDVGALKELLETITGISGQMQGQYSDGRRSATQDRVVAQGASARAKTTLGTSWADAMEPLGRQLVANNRQEMDFDTFSKIVGEQNDPAKPSVEELFFAFKATPEDIALGEDFFVFDGTLPSEKAFLAQSLQEVLLTVMSNPAIMQVLGYGPEQIRFLFNEMYELRGVTPPSLPDPTPPPQAGQPGGQAQNVLPIPQQVGGPPS